MMDPEGEMRRFLRPFGVEVPKNIIVKGRRIYQVSDELRDAIKDVKLDSYSIGLPLGELTLKGFKPSFPLLDRMKGTSNKVVINREAEWLFVCGRDVFKDNILKKGDLKNTFLVVNKHNEVLGLGELMKSNKGQMIHNLLDRGDFLRREEKRKKKK